MLDFIGLERGFRSPQPGQKPMFPPKLGTGLLKYNTSFSSANQAGHKTHFSFGAKEAKLLNLSFEVDLRWRFMNSLMYERISFLDWWKRSDSKSLIASSAQESQQEEKSVGAEKRSRATSSSA